MSTQDDDLDRRAFKTAVDDFSVKLVRPSLGSFVAQVVHQAEKLEVPQFISDTALIVSLAEACGGRALASKLAGVSHWRKVVLATVERVFRQAALEEAQEKRNQTAVIPSKTVAPQSPAILEVVPKGEPEPEFPTSLKVGVRRVDNDLQVFVEEDLAPLIADLVASGLSDDDARKKLRASVLHAIGETIMTVKPEGGA